MLNNGDFIVNTRLTDEQLLNILTHCFADYGSMRCDSCCLCNGNGLRSCMSIVGKSTVNYIKCLNEELKKED